MAQQEITAVASDKNDGRIQHEEDAGGDRDVPDENVSGRGILAPPDDFDPAGSTEDDDDGTIDDYLDRELDREIEEMIRETQRQLDDELQRQIDERLQADFDRQLEGHFADLEEAARRRACDQREELRRALLGGSEASNGGSKKPTVVEINTQIEEIVARYASTIALGSSEHPSLSNPR